MCSSVNEGSLTSPFTIPLHLCVVGGKKPSPGKCNSLHQHLLPSLCTHTQPWQQSMKSPGFRAPINGWPPIVFLWFYMSAQFYTLCIEFSAWIAVDFSAQVHPTFFILAFSCIRCGSSCYSCFQRTVTRMPYTENELIMWLLLPLYCVARKESFSMWRWWLRCQ